MSVVAALKFLERMEKEETLRTQAYISRIESVEMLARFAHGKGFVISHADLTQALAEYQPKLKGALDALKQLPAKIEA